jgi:uncharacterized protein YcfJ
MMDRMFRKTGWSCAWGSTFGALFGGIIDFFIGTSGLFALVLAGAGSLLGSYVGLRIELTGVEHPGTPTTVPSEVAGIHKQHGVMWALMGAMVGGVVGSTLGAGVASVGWLLYTDRVPNMMDYMNIVMVMMGGGMGGMTAGVVGAWWSAVRAGFIGEKRGMQLQSQQTNPQGQNSSDECGTVGDTGHVSGA